MRNRKLKDESEGFVAGKLGEKIAAGSLRGVGSIGHMSSHGGSRDNRISPGEGAIEQGSENVTSQKLVSNELGNISLLLRTIGVVLDAQNARDCRRQAS